MMCIYCWTIVLYSEPLLWCVYTVELLFYTVNHYYDVLYCWTIVLYSEPLLWCVILLNHCFIQWTIIMCYTVEPLFEKVNHYYHVYILLNHCFIQWTTKRVEDYSRDRAAYANKKALALLLKPASPTPSKTELARSFQRDTEKGIKVLLYCKVLQRGCA